MNTLMPEVENTVITKQSELDPKDRVMIEMHSWCERQGDLVVLNSGLILASDLASRSVQNCKIVLKNKGLPFLDVLPASQELINMLLSNKDDSLTSVDASSDQVSLQQQRLRMLVREAVQVQASDIHIEVRQEVAKVKFRKHGELYLHAEWVPKVGRELAAVAFNKETDHAISHFNPLVPQNASMPMHLDGAEIRLRLASMPAHGGFDMVMRILSMGDENVITLDELGYTAEQMRLIKKALQMPHGAILFAGPTASGKTTTLASCMQHIEGQRKIYTIEDPVEKLIKNATQVPVNTDKEDRGFANMGKSALRMDPDVMVLGEMRDEATARVFIRTAITGHLALSTVHTNSAANIVTRLVDMGISPSLLADNHILVLLLFQRLVPVNCVHCAEPLVTSRLYAEQADRWRQYFRDAVSTIFVRGEGCHHCNQTGIGGRTVIAELIWIDEQSREFIQKSDSIAWEKYLRGRGWKSYRDHGIDLIRQGKCDPFLMEKVIGELSSNFSAEQFDYRNI